MPKGRGGGLTSFWLRKRNQVTETKVVPVDEAGEVPPGTPQKGEQGAEDDDPPLKEPPSSWHHVVRLRCLANDGRSTQNRCVWYCSAISLVLVQFCVMLSFQSALAIRRCTSQGNCASGSYCAGLTTAPRAMDPLSNHDGKINRGWCMGCSTKEPNEKMILDYLEELCPPPSAAGGFATPVVPQTNNNNGTVCLFDCLLNCDSTFATVDVATVHVDIYTDSMSTCASDCADTCEARLTGDAAKNFAEAKPGNTKENEKVGQTYQTWLSLYTQCGNCAASLRQGVRYMTPAEFENLNVLKMSFFDFVSLGLASLIVALTMMREVRDMNIGQMMTLQALVRDRERAAKERDGEMELCPAHAQWMMALGLPTFLRRYIILPDVAATVITLVVRLGGDTVAIMLNTLATLFMLELDNLAFDYGLTSTLKEDVEEKFDVTLGPSQTTLLGWSRRWHTIVLTLFFVVMTHIVVAPATVWNRLRICSITLILIIAVGELMELIMRWKYRTRQANRERTVMFVFKLTLAIIWKYFIFELQYGLATFGVFLR